MNFLLVSLASVALVSLVASAPAPEPEVDSMAALKEMLPILYDVRTMDEDGYKFEFETADGQHRKEVGMILNRGKTDETKVVMGEYSFTDAFGKPRHYMYISDKNGYRVMQARRKENEEKLRKSLLG